MRKGHRFWCSTHVSLCDCGESRPRRERCSRCGSSLIVQEGTWGVFAWEAANLYRAESALATYAVKSAAEKRAEKIDGAVVRFIPSSSDPRPSRR